MTNIELRNIIIRSKDYEEEFVRDQLSVILEERLEREKSKGINCPSNKEPKQPTFKPTCYSCGRVGHTEGVMLKIIRKPSLLARINAVETTNVFKNNHLQF
ncbi:hypothetical protein TNCV_4179831 [Trichonephila clavipes]|nr:hypothetical protein TNCV_4179831 [Trichonephila clavipes]